MRNIIAVRAPWMESDEAAEVIQSAASSPRKWTSTALGEELGLTEADRRRLGIRTIAAADMTPEQRRQAKRLRDRQRQCRHRRTKGMKARVYLVALGTVVSKNRMAQDCHTLCRTVTRRQETHVHAYAQHHDFATQYGYHFRSPDPTEVTFRRETDSSRFNRGYVA
jgi:hypothetical protein